MSINEQVKVRLQTTRGVLLQLNHAKSQQDSKPKNPSAGKGVWISFQLWRALSRQLQSQISEIQEWDKLLVLAQQDAGVTRQQASNLEQALLHQQHATQQQVAGLESKVAQQEATMQEQQTFWNKQRDDLTQQADRALKMLQEREQAAVDNAHLLESLRQAQMAAAQADVRVQEAEQRAAAIQQQSEYFMDKSSDGRADRTVLAHQVRDLSLALSHARAQAEQYRQQQGLQQRPMQELLNDLHRLKVDNERLVGLLSETKAWKRIAKDLSTEGGAHYVPVEEALVHKGGVGSVYTPLKDRPFVLDKVATDPDEDWHWVPKQAVSAALEAINLLTPAMPKEPVLHVLLSLNKIWRQREDKKLAAVTQQHAAELRELHKLYRQRAPYEAVVGNTRLSDLKKQLRLQAAHAQQLAAAAAGSKEEAVEDGKMFLALGLDSINSLNQQVARLQNRNTRLSQKLSSVHKKQPLCPACSSLALLQGPRPSSSPIYPSMPGHSGNPEPTNMTLDPSVLSKNAQRMATTSAAAEPSNEDYHYKSAAPTPGASSEPQSQSQPAGLGKLRAAAAAPVQEASSRHGEPSKPYTAAAALSGSSIPAHSQAQSQSQASGTAPFPRDAQTMPGGPQVASIPLGSSTSYHGPQAPVRQRPPRQEQLLEQWGGSADPWRASVAAHKEPGFSSGVSSRGGGTCDSGASTSSKPDSFGSTFLVGGDQHDEGGTAGVVAHAQGRMFGATAGGPEGGSSAARFNVDGAAVGMDGIAASGGSAVGVGGRSEGQGPMAGSQAEQGRAGLGAAGREVKQGTDAEIAASTGAGNGSSGNNRADSLVRLIQRYEQPVLRFSLWDRDGHLLS
ncbi:hypothetical protein DUNSADRAFT_7267 [Dunaliella salina]|uniref:Uncharacterized protein n=1 Tax=Dunaliella salina TaxID=3046 RepID=A0ABQ7GLU3_DUNSA|nr:hypothetical protein DUNSADRAFT_7267 [Dunaliella salina]|eukprot:KAF5835528.1 hypothetical protein DUNSADRAFT_7267 [Dunaliella salina]